MSDPVKNRWVELERLNGPLSKFGTCTSTDKLRLVFFRGSNAEVKKPGDYQLLPFDGVEAVGLVNLLPTPVTETWSSGLYAKGGLLLQCELHVILKVKNDPHIIEMVALRPNEQEKVALDVIYRVLQSLCLATSYSQLFGKLSETSAEILNLSRPGLSKKNVCFEAEDVSIRRLEAIDKTLAENLLKEEIQKLEAVNKVRRQAEQVSDLEHEQQLEQKRHVAKLARERELREEARTQQQADLELANKRAQLIKELGMPALFAAVSPEIALQTAADLERRKHELEIAQTRTFENTWRHIAIESAGSYSDLLEGTLRSRNIIVTKSVRTLPSGEGSLADAPEEKRNDSVQPSPTDEGTRGASKA